MFKQLFAFSFAEVLISLSVLGILAAVSIPNLYHSVKENQAQSKMKQYVTQLQQLTLEGHHMGEWQMSQFGLNSTADALVNQLHNKLNAATHCQKGSSQPQCDFKWLDGSGSGTVPINNGARWVMPDGTHLSMHESTNNEQLVFLLDVMPEAAPEQGKPGATQLALSCNISEGEKAFNNGLHTARPGECQPATQEHAITFLALYGQGATPEAGGNVSAPPAETPQDLGSKPNAGNGGGSGKTKKDKKNSKKAKNEKNNKKAKKDNQGNAFGKRDKSPAQNVKEGLVMRVRDILSRIVSR